MSEHWSESEEGSWWFLFRAMWLAIAYDYRDNYIW